MTSSAASSAATAGDSTPAIVSPSISTSAGWGPVGFTTVPPRISVRTGISSQVLAGGQSRAGQIGVGVRAAVPVERPRVAHLVDEAEVQVPDDQLAVVTGARVAD